MTTSHTQDMADSMKTVARGLHGHHGVQDVLQALVAGAVDVFPEVDHAGITVMHRDGRMETLVTTSEVVDHLARLQRTLHEGPLVDSLTTTPVVVCQEAHHEQRWPGYIPAAVAIGLRAQVGLRLHTETHTIGGLNLYFTSSSTISEDTLAMAEVYASYVTAALGRAQAEDDMTRALGTRQLIGQATGVVMERYQLDPVDAFAFLVRAASTSETKLRDVARRVVEGDRLTEVVPTAEEDGPAPRR